jgi:hypothetical protein
MEKKQEVGHKDYKKKSIEDSQVDCVEDDVTFFHDFIAGGIAGSASVAVGHPFDTIKVGRPFD